MQVACCVSETLPPGRRYTPKDDFFHPGHIGSWWRLAYSSVWGWLKVTNYISSSQVQAEVQKDLNGTGETSGWREGAFSTYRGWPAACIFHDERLVIGGTKAQPQTIWGSLTADFEKFTPEDPITDQGPWTYSFASDQENPIIWMLSAQMLMIGTTGAEWKVSATNASAAITPTDVNVRRVNTKGSAQVRPVIVGQVVLFLQKVARKLRELTYQFAYDIWTAPDLTIISEHITRGGIIDMAFQDQPDQTIWAVRSDGVLLSMVYEREQEVVGWSRHHTSGLVEAVTTIPGPTQGEVWLVVNRTINGATRRYVEVLSDLDWGDDPQDAFFVDAGLTYDGPPVTVISGLDHLEGMAVAILADGWVQAPLTVSGGSVTLDQAAAKVHAGLGYSSIFKTIRLEGGAQLGTSQGKIKRLTTAVLRLFQSAGGKAGPDLDNLENIINRTPEDNMDQAVPLFSGDVKVDIRGDYDREGQLMIVQDDPLPLTICAIMTNLDTFED